MICPAFKLATLGLGGATDDGGAGAGTAGGNDTSADGGAAEEAAFDAGVEPLGRAVSARDGASAD
jgi:hypothetical protein